MKVDYKSRLNGLSKLYGGRCQCCGREDEHMTWRWIMPPEYRKNEGLEASVYLCSECLENGSKVYPWWRENE